MRILSVAVLLFFGSIMCGCDDATNRTVTEDADAKAIADYEAALEAATSDVTEEEMTEEEE
ncbi:hypothetical protein RMSM_01469 [Rhodopirellula maiorica SM1]|uniref:Secreted protein n=1 Tax=Rhodopirellula maiorica SM1 TaxID=1265738 RepID=M5RQN8_9BACT|nr:hypothetical protein [Rhodopirellula maiorica]EMI21610.1 hypothetical protein RMSM_01469 [Rhodopirellula maiorica SM1]